MPGPTSRVDHAVFVDRYGRRRRLVVGTGLVVALALVAWLAVMALAVADVVGQADASARPAIDAPY
jgi:MFS family permease